MTWSDDIEHALRRCNSPYTVTDVIRWLRNGDAVMAVGDKMHGSVWFKPDGTAEIAHLAGQWDADDASWLRERLQEVALARGYDFVEINGRKGWERFLKIKGVHIDGCVR